jgi:hypothetical protein
MVLAEKMRGMSRKNILIAAMVVMVILIIGYGYAISRADSSYASFEVEDGTVGGNGPVTTGTDASASAGKYVQFNPKP